ncbi:unnamed protein product [Alopecurus aequalis]
MAGLGTGGGAPVVKLYHERSMILPDVSRVLACLYEKNVQFETETASYKDILRLQATRSVPVPFYDGPTFRQESRAICRYIAETYEQRGYPFLLGKDVLERASIEQWLRHEEHAFDPPSRALFCHLAFPLHDEDMSEIDREKRKLEEVLEVYEQRLGESEFLAGNKFTLADLVHLPNTYHIVESEFAYLYDSRKNVQRWWNTISARDSWQQVVRDMQSVEEQNQIEELEQQQLEQQWQWETEPPPTSGRLRIDPRQQTGTESRTILVPPPNGGAISSSVFTVQQEQKPLSAEATSHAPNQRKESNFFTATQKTSPPSKQRTPITQEPPSSVQSTRSNFFTPATPPTTIKMSPKTDKDKASSRDASSPTKPTPQEATKTSDRVFQARQTSEAVAPSKSNSGSPTSVQSTTSGFFIPPNTTTMPQRANTDKFTYKGASSPTTPTQGSSKDAPDKIHLSDFYKASNHTDETASKTSDRISAPRQTSEVVAPDKPSPASPKTPSRIDGPDFYGTERKPTSVKDSTKEAREADQKRAASSTARELPSGSQIIPQQSKAPPTSLKASGLSPEQEKYEDTQGEDERFSTKRLRKMLEQSDPAALKSQSKDLQTPPIQEETPSIYKNPSYVQDRKGQDGNSSSDRKTDGTPSNGTRDPGTLSMPSQSPTTEGVDRREQPRTPNETSTEQSDKSSRQTPPAPLQALTSDGRSVSTALRGGIADARRKNEAITNPRDQAPPPSSFADRRNVKTGIDEASQTAIVVPDEQPGGRAPKNSENKPISSKDTSKQTNETIYYTSSETSSEMAPTVSQKSMEQQKMQNDKSSISSQDNGKQGSEAALLRNAGQDSGKTPGQSLHEYPKQTSPDTQQVKNNRSNSTLDGSSKPTRQFDDNEGDGPEKQRGG